MRGEGSFLQCLVDILPLESGSKGQNINKKLDQKFFFLSKSKSELLKKRVYQKCSLTGSGSIFFQCGSRILIRIWICIKFNWILRPENHKKNVRHVKIWEKSLIFYLYVRTTFQWFRNTFSSLSNMYWFLITTFSSSLFGNSSIISPPPPPW